MLVVVAVFFLGILFLTMVAVSVGQKFLDARRRQHVVDILHTAAGETTVGITTLLKEIEPDRPTGFKAILRALQFTRHSQELLQQAGMSWSSSRLLAAMALMTVPGVVLGFVFPILLSGPVTAFVLAGIMGAAPYLFVRQKRKQRMDRMEEQLPEALDFLARSMRAGHAFTITLEMVGEEIVDPLGQEFRTLFNEQNLGAPLDIAMRNFATRVPLLDIRFFTSSVLLQKQTGGNLSEILSRLAYVIRERFRLKGQVKAASAHGRLTANILTIMPVATMLGLLLVAPGYLQGMAEDSDGKWMIGGAIVAQILGKFFINKIINIKV